MTLAIAFRHNFADCRFDIEIETPTPGTTVLFGPSGAGKSTIVAVVAGLLRPREQQVVVDGIVLADSATGYVVPAERRRIGLVFQDARLFPHLTVAQNLRYGQRRAPDQRIGWDEVVTLLGLHNLLARVPNTLSGGQRQRVAIGRALLSQPRLLVMDEPLASLDAARRAEILPYLARLPTALALPILYVTHALDEVVRLADTLVMIEAGRSVAAGPLCEISARADVAIAARADAGAILSCVVADHAPLRALTRLSLRDAPGISLLVPLQSLPPGTKLRVRVPASDIILATTAPSGISVQNVMPARIVGLHPQAAGASLLVQLSLGAARLLARVTQDAASRLSLAPGMDVVVLVKSVSVQILG